MENSVSNNTIVTANTDLLLTPSSGEPPGGGGGGVVTPGGEVAVITALRRGTTRQDIERTLEAGLINNGADSSAAAAGDNLQLSSSGAAARTNLLSSPRSGGGGGGGGGGGSSQPASASQGLSPSPSNLSGASGSSCPPSRRRPTLKGLTRAVEQDEQEPLSVVIFKWALIFAGSVMLGAVVYIMGEVIWDWIVSEKPSSGGGAEEVVRGGAGSGGVDVLLNLTSATNSTNGIAMVESWDKNGKEQRGAELQLDEAGKDAGGGGVSESNL